MRLSDEDLGAIYQDGTRRLGPERAGCPTHEELIEAAAAAPGAAAKQRLVGHLAECSDCAQRYRLLAELAPWARQAGGQPRPRAGVQRYVALAAVLCLAAGLAYWLWPRPMADPEPSLIRGTSDSLVSALEPMPGATLASAPLLLSWKAPPAPARCRVTLYDAEGTVLWSSAEVQSGTVELPESIQRRLERGRAYFWQVVVEDVTGRQESGLFRFLLAP